MEQRVVLPKFTVPGQPSRWAMRVLWGVAAVIAIQLVVFGVILWKQHRAQASAAGAPSVPPVAQVGAAPARAPAVAAPTAQPAAVAKAAAMSAATPQVSDTPATPAAWPRRGKFKAQHRWTHRGQRHGGSKALAKASRGRKRSAKPDAVDLLLKRFK